MAVTYLLPGAAMFDGLVVVSRFDPLSLSGFVLFRRVPGSRIIVSIFWAGFPATTATFTDSSGNPSITWVLPTSFGRTSAVCSVS